MSGDAERIALRNLHDAALALRGHVRIAAAARLLASGDMREARATEAQLDELDAAIADAGEVLALAADERGDDA